MIVMALDCLFFCPSLDALRIEQARQSLLQKHALQDGKHDHVRSTSNSPSGAISQEQVVVYMHIIYIYIYYMLHLLPLQTIVIVSASTGSPLEPSITLNRPRSAAYLPPFLPP